MLKAQYKVYINFTKKGKWKGSNQKYFEYYETLRLRKYISNKINHFGNQSLIELYQIINKTVNKGLMSGVKGMMWILKKNYVSLVIRGHR